MERPNIMSNYNHKLCPLIELWIVRMVAHTIYQTTLSKLSDINGSFNIKELSIHCDEIVPSPKTEGYRNRMDFVIDFEGRVGLREKGKWWKVIDGHRCFLADPEINRLLMSCDWVKHSPLSRWDRKTNSGLCGTP